jgi:hypothetical protein
MKADVPSGWVDMRLQPGVTRHTLVRRSSGRRDVRSVHLRVEVGDLRVALEVPDPAALVADLQRAIEWRDDPSPDA